MRSVHSKWPGVDDSTMNRAGQVDTSFHSSDLTEYVLGATGCHPNGERERERGLLAQCHGCDNRRVPAILLAGAHRKRKCHSCHL